MSRILEELFKYFKIIKYKKYFYKKIIRISVLKLKNIKIFYKKNIN
jgi:hypothetical protein